MLNNWHAWFSSLYADFCWLSTHKLIFLLRAWATGVWEYIFCQLQIFHERREHIIMKTADRLVVNANDCVCGESDDRSLGSLLMRRQGLRCKVSPRSAERGSGRVVRAWLKDAPSNT